MFLASSQMMLMLLAWEPHLENHRGRPRQTMQLRMGSVYPESHGLHEGGRGGREEGVKSRLLAADLQLVLLKPKCARIIWGFC